MESTSEVLYRVPVNQKNQDSTAEWVPYKEESNLRKDAAESEEDSDSRMKSLNTSFSFHEKSFYFFLIFDFPSGSTLSSDASRYFYFTLNSFVFPLASVSISENFVQLNGWLCAFLCERKM